ncbi:unnamed protein product, partial [Owenia fusiformis]
PSEGRTTPDSFHSFQTPIKSRDLNNDSHKDPRTPSLDSPGSGSPSQHGPLESTPMRQAGRRSPVILPDCTPISGRKPVARLKPIRRLSTGTEQSLRKILLSSQIKNQYKTPPTRRLSDGSQIEGATPNNTYGFKVSHQNLEGAKALHE